MESKERLVITVDGLASSGKTSIARALSQKLRFAHFNSGLLYRAVGFLAMKNHTQCTDPADLHALLHRHTIALDMNQQGASQLYIDGAPFTADAELASPEVSEAASIASQFAEVRDHLIELQRNAFRGRNIVAEGRDMGSVIFPTAPLKFFIEASEAIRAQRRLDQFLGASSSKAERELLEKQLKIEILERDKRDKERKLSPAIPAPDAIIIDNSAVSLTQVVQNMYDFASQRGLI